MSIWVKICANTSLADTQLAVDAEADAVGFVFAPSPRRVTPLLVAAITPHLPAAIEKIGVFVEGDFASITSVVEQCGLTGVQLHFAADSGGSRLTEELRQHFGPGLRILRVVHFGSETSAQLDVASTDPAIDAVLVDSRTASAVGGTGITFDWQAAQSTIFAPDRKLKLIAAGGLNLGNIAEAIATLRPWGVDVASGVESSPGRKDPFKVREFIAGVRIASS